MSRPAVAWTRDLERRRRLATAVLALGDSIAWGNVRPELVELQALAQICDEHDLPIEAARVRRWIAGRE